MVIILNSYKDLKHKILDNASKTSTPVVGEFEITANCNFKCKMCYLCNGTKKKEIPLETWKKLFLEAKDVGLLYALFTGGECFLYPDFCQLYEFVYDLGIRITIYTNGSYLNDNIVKTLVKRPPEFVSITLYGESNKTYELVTSRANAFDTVIQNIKILKTANLNILLRTIPIRPILEHIDELIAFVNQESLFLGYFLYVNNATLLANNLDSWRLLPSELQFFEHKIRSGFKEYKDLIAFHSFKTCMALKSGYYITNSLEMKPCAMANYPIKKLNENNFLETFRELGVLWENLHFDECKSCKNKQSCIACKARKMLEGSSEHCSEYLHDVAFFSGNLE
jgi:MoaA/NifB/PqqE/SkfB family radical SAM enzyme